MKRQQMENPMFARVGQGEGGLAIKDIEIHKNLS